MHLQSQNSVGDVSSTAERHQALLQLQSDVVRYGSLPEAAYAEQALRGTTDGIRHAAGAAYRRLVNVTETPSRLHRCDLKSDWISSSQRQGGWSW